MCKCVCVCVCVCVCRSTSTKIEITFFFLSSLFFQSCPLSIPPQLSTVLQKAAAVHQRAAPTVASASAAVLHTISPARLTRDRSSALCAAGRTHHGGSRRRQMFWRAPVGRSVSTEGAEVREKETKGEREAEKKASITKRCCC